MKDLWANIRKWLTFICFFGGALLIIVAFFMDENLLLMGIGMALLVVYFVLTIFNRKDVKENPDYDPNDGYNDGSDNRYL